MLQVQMLWGQEARTKKQAETNCAKVAYSAFIQDRPRVNIAAVSSDIEMVGTSNFRSSSLQTVVADKKERNRRSSTDKMQTSTENGEGEAQERHIVTLEPFVIHQSQPNAMPSVVMLHNCTSGGKIF